MDQDLIQKAIELIEKSEHVAMLLGTQADLDCLASAEVLARALIKNQKNVGFLAKPNPDAIPHSNHLTALAAGAFPPKEFVVSLDTTFAPVSQLRYDQTENKIDVIFSPKNSSLKKDFVTFREGKTMGDCLITIGVENLDSLPETDRVHPAFFTETPIINFDVSAENKNYGEINLVDPERSSLSELVYDFMSVYSSEPMSPELATVLFAGIADKTEGFKNKLANADNLLVSSELWRLGADKDLAFFMARKNNSVGLLQLAGRASVRTREDETNSLVWSYLTAEDFLKTSRDPDDLDYIINHLSSALTAKTCLAMLWQDPADRAVHITLSGKPNLLVALRQKSLGEFKGTDFAISKHFVSFKEAEDYLNSVLVGV